MKVLGMFVCMLVFLSAEAQKELVKNGGFETDLTHWRGANVATISAFEKKVGQKSCVINQFVGNDWKGLDQILYIPKKAYAVEVGLWAKATGIQTGKEAYNVGVGIIEFMNAGEKSIKSESIVQVSGSTHWTYYKKLLIIPDQAKKIRVLLALAQTTGTVLFDEVSVVAVSEVDYSNKMAEMEKASKAEAFSENSKPASFQNGDFSQGIQSWNAPSDVYVETQDNKAAYAVIHSKSEDWKAIDQTADVPLGVTAIHFSGQLKAEAIQQGKALWNNGMYIVEFTTDGQTKASEDQVIGSVTGTTNWTSVEKVLPVPEGAKKYRIMLALSACKGTLLVDDIVVTMKTD